MRYIWRSSGDLGQTEPCQDVYPHYTTQTIPYHSNYTTNTIPYKSYLTKQTIQTIPYKPYYTIQTIPDHTNYTTHTIPYKPHQVACQDDMIAETKAVSDDSNHDDEDNNYMNLDKEGDGDKNKFFGGF